MDRQIVYPGQILPETTLLQMAKDAMIGSSKLAAAMLGTSTIANGFAVTPTGPASLQIVVAPGEIYSLANIDSLAFSTLPADTTHSILKQGIMLDGVTLSCPAPTTTGQSINYLVQVTYQDQDSTPVLLPYYNSANPALPYSGMGNNGLTQNTSRKGVAIVQVKAGASAATGSQVTPAPDSGYVGLFVATVAYGQSTITSGNITQYAGAPLLPSGVLQSIQSGNTTYALDTGAVNACAATYFPAITSLVDGLTLRFKAAYSNTGATTFSPNGIFAAPIVGGNHAALRGGEIAPTGDVWVQWNSSIGSGSWVLVKSSGGNAMSGRLINVQVFRASGTYTPTAGTTSAIVEVQAGGGGGGAAAAASSGSFSTGCGGGAGGYAKGRITSPVVTSVVVGSGGTGGANGTSQPGSAGGNSSFGALITTTGGDGGSGLPNGTTAPVQLNGAPGGLGASGSITNAYGGVGGPAQAMNSANVLSGGGGASQLSPGGPQVAGNSAGQAGLFGSGGSGANVLGAFGPFAGGAGGTGAVIVWEYA